MSLTLATETGAARGLLGPVRSRRGLRGRRVFPPRRRCAVGGALLEESLANAFLVPLLDADLPATSSTLRDRRPVPQALVLDRRLCLWNSGPVSTILRVRKVVQ